MLVGIVGKTNVGKSTFFKALTLAEVEIANYPFVTIKPNEGVGFVKLDCVDKEFNVKCQAKHGYCLNGKRFVPVTLLDVAGLVPGAHQGKGLGNQFLDDLRQADVLIHVIDVAGKTNEKGEPVEDYNPLNDIKFLEDELDYWFFGLIKKGWERFAREVKQTQEELKKALLRQFSALRVNEEIIEKSLEKLGLSEKNIEEWNDKDLFALAREFRKMTKPMVIACNKIDLKKGQENFERLKKELKNYILIPCSAEAELALKEAAKNKLINYVPGDSDFEILEREKLSEKQIKALDFIKKEILEKYGSTGVQDALDKAVFNLLKYIAVFPVANSHLKDKDGNVLPDCLLVKEGTTALELAFKIHSDIGKNFIKAVDLKTKQVIGKEHELKHRDVIEIVSGR